MTEDMIVPSFGNHLCEYFFTIAQRWSENSAESVNTDKLGSIGKFLPGKEVQNLATEEQKQAIATIFDKGDIAQLAWGAKWRPERMATEVFSTFWDTMAEFKNKALNNALNLSGLTKEVTCPVIHIRCSDVPFNRHPGYHFPKKSFYHWCVQQIGKVDEVIILSNYSHRATGSDALLACAQYAEFVKAVFNEKGIKVNFQCESVLEDFSTLFYAPTVISGGSSFSFMAGYASGQFYSCQCLEKKGEIVKPALLWNYPGLPLLHSEVVDYLDTQTVISQLEEL